MEKADRELLRLSQAASYCEVHPNTIRNWVKSGMLPTQKVGRESRFKKTDLDKLLGIDTKQPTPVEALYVRVSGTAGQEMGIDGQVELLESARKYPVFKTYIDKGSGLNDKRPLFIQMLKDAQDRKFTVLRITHKDRLTRFGYDNLVKLLNSYGVTVEVLDEDSTKSSQDELLEDFMSLVASFSGRMYGMRSSEHKQKLLAVAGERT